MTNGVIRSVVIMLIGLLLIFLNVDGTRLLIRVLGVAFFLPALVSMINLYISRAQGKMLSKVLISVINVGSMAFGLWLMVAPTAFEGMFVKLMAALLLLFAVYQVVVIAMEQRNQVVPIWMFIAPLLLVVAAILLLSLQFDSLKTLSIIFGVMALVSGISDLVILLRLKKNSKSSATGVVKVN